MKVLFFDNINKTCNYYSDIRNYFGKAHEIKVVSNNIHHEIQSYKPEIVIVGFSITDCGESSPKVDLNHVNVPLYIVLNKEYAGLHNKLNWIKSITPAPKKVFSVHHDVESFQTICNIPFHRIMWSADETIFKKYDNNYIYDLFFSGVIRKEQTNNMRFKIYNKLHYLKDKKIKVNAAFFENNKLRGQLYTMSNTEYAQTISDSKIVLTTTGPGDLVGTRYFEIMASNKALIMCNNMPTDIYMGIFIDKHNCVMFDDADDFIRKVKYYIEHEEERLKIVGAAYNDFITKYSWNHTVTDIIRNL